MSLGEVLHGVPAAAQQMAEGANRVQLHHVCCHSVGSQGASGMLDMPAVSHPEALQRLCMAPKMHCVAALQQHCAAALAGHQSDSLGVSQRLTCHVGICRHCCC